MWTTAEIAQHLACRDLSELIFCLVEIFFILPGLNLGGFLTWTSSKYLQKRLEKMLSVGILLAMIETRLLFPRWGLH